jgi:L-histidine N-alpha-methyltransferase
VVTHSIATESITEFAAEVRAGLSKPDQKQLPPKYFYDDIGSALFEVISVLPEYGLTRADERLLRKHSSQIAASLAPPIVVAELGSGTGRKTRWMLEALCRRQPTAYYPIEISAAALAVCERELRAIDALSIHGLGCEYLHGLSEVAAGREDGQRLLVLFLGSSIGNFEHEDAVNFLKGIRALLNAGDAVLLGTDLEKPAAQLALAYDDPLGVTAAFNLNLLARMNRELDSDFRLRNFEHCVKFDQAARSIEMYLRSTSDQTATIPKADFSVALARGEMILTERSHKYSLDEVSALAEVAGFRCREQFVDHKWPFAESLLFAE